jgi:hypothetical protein
LSGCRRQQTGTNFPIRGIHFSMKKTLPDSNRHAPSSSTESRSIMRMHVLRSGKNHLIDLALAPTSAEHMSYRPHKNMARGLTWKSQTKTLGDLAHVGATVRSTSPKSRAFCLKKGLSEHRASRQSAHGQPVLTRGWKRNLDARSARRRPRTIARRIFSRDRPTHHPVPDMT